MGPGLELTDDEQRMLGGGAGAGTALAMRVVTALARAVAARRLLEVTAAHVDGCLYHGVAGLDFAERLVALGARVKVPTTLNVGSLDLLHPGLVRADAETAVNGRRLMEAYRALGAEPTWTCAPYQEPAHRPGLGEHVAWAESNAIVFANSVLGARTERYGDFVDVSAAITGRVPAAGLHLAENRAASLVLDCHELPAAILAREDTYPVLGHLLGRIAGTRVAVLDGLPRDVDEDRLKALGAAAASSGGVALFHAVGVTPEAPTLSAALRGEQPRETVRVGLEQLRAARGELSTADGTRLDAVSVGTPHFSVAEFRRLAKLVADGPEFDPDVAFYVSTSRAVLASADALGHVEPCLRAGARVLVDTCTYVTPVLSPSVRVVMTNSAKWAYYAPGNLGVDVVFGSLEECVASARAGTIVREALG